MSVATSIRLSGDIGRAVTSRIGRDEGAATVIRRDLERYYALLRLLDSGAGDKLTVTQALTLVGEYGSTLSRRNRRGSRGSP